MGKKMDSKVDIGEECTSRYYIRMSKLRIMKNNAVVSLGVMLLYSSFLALANLQSTINVVGNIGVISQSTIYAVMIISALILPKLVIKRFGCKLSFIFSILAHTPYIAANFYPTAWTLLSTAIFAGVGSGTLLTSCNTYINQLSFIDAKGDSSKAVFSGSKLFGIFLMIASTSQIWGNMVSFYVLRVPMDGTSISHHNVSVVNYQDAAFENVTCSLDFCGGMTQTLQPVTAYRRYLLVGIFCGLAIMAAVITALFLDSLTRNEQKANGKKEMVMKLLATLKQMMKADQLLISVLTIFSGMQLGFISGDYTKAYVACALGIENVGLVMVCFGITTSISAVCGGHLLKIVPRWAMLTAAGLSNAGVLFALNTWNFDSDKSHYFIVAGFWGLSNAIWITQLCAFYGALFRSNEEAAYGNYDLFRALGYAIAFGCSSVLCTSSKIYMVAGFLSFGMAGYFTVELRMRRKKIFVASEPESCNESENLSSK